MFLILLVLFSCNTQNTENDYVLIETEYGNMKIKLYDETPKHKANFLKLVNEGFYDNLLFHKVIKEYIIQGGDPDSRYAEADETLGSSGPGYKLAAEINKNICSKKGVLIAARQSDAINPNKKSSGSQFFIVTGRKFTEGELKSYEKQMNITLKNQYLSNYIKNNPETGSEIGVLQYEERFKEMDSLIAEIEKEINIPNFRIPELHKKDYITLGGIPDFTGEYTIFGEIVEGLEVIDKISNADVGKEYRPTKDIKMKISICK